LTESAALLFASLGDGRILPEKFVCLPTQSVSLIAVALDLAFIVVRIHVALRCHLTR
jgi:hypothetical protein